MQSGCFAIRTVGRLAVSERHEGIADGVAVHIARGHRPVCTKHRSYQYGRQGVTCTQSIHVCMQCSASNGCVLPLRLLSSRRAHHVRMDSNSLNPNLAGVVGARVGLDVGPVVGELDEEVDRFHIRRVLCSELREVQKIVKHPAHVREKR